MALGPARPLHAAAALCDDQVVPFLTAAAEPGAAPTTHMASSDILTDDPYLWLEDVLGDPALAWVRAHNAQARQALEAWPRFAETRDQLRAILDSKEQISGVVRRGEWFWNFWRDDKNPRGLWRRATLDEYRKPHPAWDVVIDLDALAKQENENWVWAGTNCLAPKYERCVIMLSRGGSDAHVTREFDMVERVFVTDGFTLPEAKSSVDWIDANTLYVTTDFGPGSLTDSGYPRVVKRWSRGTPLASATTMFEAEHTDVAAGMSVDDTPGYERTTFSRSLDFYTSRVYLLAPLDAAGKAPQLTLIDKPDDANLAFWRDRVLIELRSDWTP